MLAIVIAGVLVVAGGTAPANAWQYSGGMRSATFQIKPWSYNSTWTTPMNNALSTWNAAATEVNITKNSSAAAYVTAASYADTWYGLYTPGFGTFNIKLNSRTRSADAGNYFANYVRSTFAHELGHSLSLADNPNTTSSSLMKHSRNRATLFSPTTYDINNVKFVY